MAVFHGPHSLRLSLNLEKYVSSMFLTVFYFETLVFILQFVWALYHVYVVTICKFLSYFGSSTLVAKVIAINLHVGGFKKSTHHSLA